MSQEFNEKLTSGEIQWRDAVDYFGCVHEPLFNGPEDTPIIYLVPPDELHLMLRITNKIIVLLKWQVIKLGMLPIDSKTTNFEMTIE